MTPDDDLIRSLHAAVPKWSDDQPPGDLWPRMLRRVDQAPPRFGWLEAILLAALVALFVIYPDIVPVLLWHL